MKLLEYQIEILMNLPETGMGYQKVKLTFNNGEVLNDMTVLNSEILLVEDDQSLSVHDIEKIEIEKK